MATLPLRAATQSLPFWEGGPLAVEEGSAAIPHNKAAPMRGDTMQHNSKLTSRAQELRKNMTREERRLWYKYLRSYPYRFRRQVTFGNFILDFYCAAARLAIELDGSQHYNAEGMARDAQRTAFLEGNGIYVLRFSNADVMRNLRGVCEQINLVVQQRVSDIPWRL